MKRLLLSITTVLITIGTLFAPFGATAQESTVPVEDLVLTVAEGEGWSYSLDAEKQPIVSMVPMMIDGEPQLEFAPVVLDLYQEHQLMDAYAWSADLLPANYEPISTTIEIRVMTFADAENATAFQGEFFEQLMALSAPEANVTAIDPLPDSNMNLLGLTSMKEYTNYENDEPIGMAGSVRYLAQIDNTVISVEVAGPLVDYNFDAAFTLIDTQATCITSVTACQPVTMLNSEDTWALTENGIVFVTEGDAENEWARWVFPLEEPVTAPEWSITIP